MQQPSMRQRGFTLVELLVVISIIALLISILLPSLRRARDQAKDAVCRSNLKQLGFTNIYYSEDNNGRLAYIQGSPDAAPYHQYEQIFHYWPYLKVLDVYICPRAKLGQSGGRPTGSPVGPTSVKGYEYGIGPNRISYYEVLSASDRFISAYQRNDFPSVDNPFDPARNGRIEELYTEYWYNDWGEGATIAGRPIPRISGGQVNKIPYPEYAVVMADAVNWNPRHTGANQFSFLDTHVERIPEERYFDPNGIEPRVGYDPTDTDSFGNRPFWAWGLGQNVKGY